MSKMRDDYVFDRSKTIKASLWDGDLSCQEIGGVILILSAFYLLHLRVNHPTLADSWIDIFLTPTAQKA